MMTPPARLRNGVTSTVAVMVAAVGLLLTGCAEVQTQLRRFSFPDRRPSMDAATFSRMTGSYAGEVRVPVRSLTNVVTHRVTIAGTAHKPIVKFEENLPGKVFRAQAIAPDVLLLTLPYSEMELHLRHGGLQEEWHREDGGVGQGFLRRVK